MIHMGLYMKGNTVYWLLGKPYLMLAITKKNLSAWWVHIYNADKLVQTWQWCSMLTIWLIFRKWIVVTYSQYFLWKYMMKAGLTFLVGPRPTGGSPVAACLIQQTIISMRLVSCRSSKGSSMGPGSSSSKSVIHSQSFIISLLSIRESTKYAPCSWSWKEDFNS